MLNRKVRMRGENDCLTACVSTLFDINYDEVPLFAKVKPKQWLARLSNWVNKKGYDAHIEYEIRLPIKGKFIAVGTSPRDPKETHAVITDENLNILFDPAGKKNPVKELEYIIMFKEKNGQDDRNFQ